MQQTVNARGATAQIKVLVTGHNGYIGSVAAPMLQEAGHDVTGLDTYFYEGCDVTAELLEGYDGIVHLAALSNDPLGELDAELTPEINLRSTVELARKAKEAGVRRFVFASPCSMYGASGTDDLMTEEALLRPLTAYADRRYARRRLWRSRAPTSRPPSCATPARTAPRRASASTSCSTIWRPGRSRVGRCAS